MEIIAYAKIISSTSLEYAPSQYNGISNFNKCEDLMLQNGFYPVIKQETEDKPVFSYKISQEKIDLVVTTLDNIKKQVRVNYIYKEYSDYSLETLKEQKCQEIKSEKIKRLMKGAAFIFDSKEYHCQLDSDGKANILGIKAKISDGKYDDGSLIYFKTYENVVLHLTKEQFLRLADIAFDYSEFVVMEKEALLDEINDCTDAKELDSIVWEDPKPMEIDK